MLFKVSRVTILRSYNFIHFCKKRLTNPNSYVIVIGRMEELRSFFYAQNCLRQNKRLKHNNKIKVEVEVVRTKITLACTECKQRNYNMTKDKKTHPDRMETKKYCRFCKSHTLHKETK